MKNRWRISSWCLCVLILNGLNHSQAVTPGDLALPTESVKTPSSPPREYFSLNMLFLRDKLMIHVGHDMINQEYVVFPSPNVHHVERLGPDKRRIYLQQYFPDLEGKVLSNFNITPSKLHYLYISRYEVFDQNGNLLERISIPDGVQYRPPQNYQLEVKNDVKILSFVMGFVGRTAWADSGVSSSLQGIFHDLREMGIDRDSSINLGVKPGTELKAYEVYTSQENQKIAQLLSNFHFLVAWGSMAEKEDLMSQILKLKDFQEVNIDLTKGAEDLKKYPHLFGGPMDAKWQSVIRKISSEKFSEREIQKGGSATNKLGLKDLFNVEHGSAQKQDDRLQEMVKFGLEGEVYVPKSLQFYLRSNDTFTVINNLVFQAYNHLEEANYKIGTGVSLEEVDEGPSLTVVSNGLSSPSALKKPVDYRCPQSMVFGGIKSSFTRNAPDRSYQYECRQIVFYQTPVVEGACSPSTWTVIGEPSKHECAGDSFLVGEKSQYAAPVGDRSFSYDCCTLETPDRAPLKKGKCRWSPWLNSVSNSVSYSCPKGTVESGVQTDYISASYLVGRWDFGRLWDRRFKVQCCEFGLK